MKVEQVKISEVKTNPKNPRLIKDDKFKKLVKSIQEFPQMLELRPIVVDENNIVLGGNMRLKACKEAGLKEVFIVKAENLTELQKDEFIVKDNVGFGEWDWDMLANEWDAELLNDWALNVPNYSLGLDVNNMTDANIDIEEEFDPVGLSKGLTRLVILFDSIIIAKEWIEKNNLQLDYKKKGNDENIILQVNMSSNYGI
jgi:hypothetical protein